MGELMEDKHKKGHMQLLHDIDEGVREVVKLFNKIKGVETISSCEGHPREGHIFFEVNKEPEWMWKIMEYIKENLDSCLGCWNVRWGRRCYYDCSHERSDYYYFEIKPRKDMEVSKEQVMGIWRLVEDALRELKVS